MDEKISRISERLKEALEIRHMTAAELSRRTGVKEADISHYKKGDYEPASKNLEKMAAALNVSIPWLMGFDVPMQDDPRPQDRVNEFRNEQFRKRQALFEMAEGASEEALDKTIDFLSFLKSQEGK